jgi:hypothetical protein
MPLSYNTPPPSASRHLHFACALNITEYTVMYFLSLWHSRLFQNHFLRFPMADSCLSLNINPYRPSHQLVPDTHQHCFSTPAHMSNQLSDRLCPGMLLCPVLTTRLAAITASRIRNLGQDPPGSSPTPSQALLHITINHTRSMPSPTHLSYPELQSEQHTSRSMIK